MTKVAREKILILRMLTILMEGKGGSTTRKLIGMIQCHATKEVQEVHHKRRSILTTTMSLKGMVEAEDIKSQMTSTEDIKNLTKIRATTDESLNSTTPEVAQFNPNTSQSLETGEILVIGIDQDLLQETLDTQFLVTSSSQKGPDTMQETANSEWIRSDTSLLKVSIMKIMT